MILLGGYHQIKLHFVMVQLAQRGNMSQKQFEILPATSRRNSKVVQYGKEYFDPFRRFSKTIKIELIIGIVVLVISAFLTITSPPSAAMSNSQMQMQELTSGNPDNGIGGEDQHNPRTFDGFAVMALILAVIVLIMSLYYYRKSKQELKITGDLLRKRGSSALI
jgi:preprotein translocase subunit YajC